MKKLIFASIIIGALAFKSADAQISINVNIGSQPDWGPTGYDHVDYYYMPDIDSYYDVPNRQYIYLNGNTWTRTTVLPARYSNYDLYHGYKVVVNQPKPWTQHNVYKTKYAVYRNHRDQPVIRDSRDVKYVRVQKGRPQQNNHPQQGRPVKSNGNGHGNDKHNDHH